MHRHRRRPRDYDLATGRSIQIPPLPLHHEEEGALMDEISLVLQHFRPKPFFWLREQRLIGGKLRAAAPGFSSVVYCQNDQTIVTSYVHPNNKNGQHTTLLKFQVSCHAPFAVSCVMDPNNHHEVMSLLSERFQERLHQMCKDLSSLSKTEKAVSLFAVMSKLLLQLQNLPPAETTGAVAATDKKQMPIVSSQVADVAWLLLYCATSSRRSTTLCTPVPAPFRSDKNGDVFTQQLLFSLLNDDKTNAAVFRTFLLSLGWTMGSTLQFVQQRRDGSKTTTTTTASRQPATATLCLDLDYGDPPPQYTQKAHQYGTLTVFHGTPLENVWSILNHGLLNLSNTPLQQNGAMMGKGVYFSTSQEVASFFANHKGSCMQWRGPGRQPPALQRLLSDNYCFGYEKVPPADAGSCSISCFAVLEATIPAPPPATTASKTQNRQAQNNATMTRRDGKYFVVPNHEDVVLTKLYLTFMIAQNPKIPEVVVWLLVLMVALAVLAARFL